MIPDYEQLPTFVSNAVEKSTQIKAELKPMFLSMSEMMDNMFGQVNGRLDSIESRVGDIENKLGEHILSCAGKIYEYSGE